MESKAKILGHAGHQLLIVFPLGLLPVAVVFDIIGLFTRNNFWFEMSFYMIAAGLIGGAVASVFGLIDYLAIPSDTRAKRIGFLHGTGNVIVMGAFALSWLLRYQDTQHTPGTFAIILSILGFGIAGVTGWLGGELVDRLGVGVDDGAHLNASNSLTKESIRNTAGDS